MLLFDAFISYVCHIFNLKQMFMRRRNGAIEFLCWSKNLSTLELDRLIKHAQADITTVSGITLAESVAWAYIMPRLRESNSGTRDPNSSQNEREEREKWKNDGKTVINKERWHERKMRRKKKIRAKKEGGSSRMIYVFVFFILPPSPLHVCLRFTFLFFRCCMSYHIVSFFLPRDPALSLSTFC